MIGIDTGSNAHAEAEYAHGILTKSISRFVQNSELNCRRAYGGWYSNHEWRHLATADHSQNGAELFLHRQSAPAEDFPRKPHYVENAQKYQAKTSLPCRGNSRSHHPKQANAGTFGKLRDMLATENGILSVRNLGQKSAKEIKQQFFEEWYTRLLPYEKVQYWQEVLDA